MANYPGIIPTGNLPVELGTDAGTAPGSVRRDFEPNAPDALDPAQYLLGATTFVDAKPDKVTNTNYSGFLGWIDAGSEFWFEKVHVIPRRFDFGNLLTSQQEPFEIFNAFRDTDQSWTAFINNAGEGVSIVSQPSLPTTIGALEGLQLTLSIETTGEASVDTTLDFVFSSGTTSVPITLERVVLFPLQPEAGYRETLEFLTEILGHVDGSEQRIALRKNPRQLFDWTIAVPDGASRSRLENIIYEWQRRIFGIPIWHEATRLTVAATTGDTTINVRETAYRDFRVGSLVVVYVSDTQNDVGTIATSGLGATTITLESGLLSDYPVGTLVVPLRTGSIRGLARGRRYPSGAQELRIGFRVDDNDSDLADTSSWTMLNSKVLLDGNNAIGQTLTESFDQQVTIIDNETGVVSQISNWDYNKRISNKTFWTNSVQGLWTVRQLLHALRGRQVSFYLPTFADDLQPTQPLTSGSTDLTVVNVGYTQFVRNRQNKNIIRIEFVSGTTPLIRTISSSSEDSSTEETLTLSTTWPATYQPSEIKKISFIEEVRFDSDDIRIEHTTGQRTTRISAPVRTVFE